MVLCGQSLFHKINLSSNPLGIFLLRTEMLMSLLLKSTYDISGKRFPLYPYHQAISLDLHRRPGMLHNVGKSSSFLP